MPAHSIVVRRATFDDVPALTQIMTRAFQHDAYTRLRYGFSEETPADEKARLDEQREVLIRQQYKAQLSESAYLVDLALLDGAPIGAAVWQLELGASDPHPLKKYVRALKLNEQVFGRLLHLASSVEPCLPSMFQLSSSIPLVRDQETTRRYHNVQCRRMLAYEKWFPRSDERSDYMVLSSLCVLPEHQRKGVGSALLKAGCGIAEHSEVPIYVISSQAGKQLYLRHGFEVLEEYSMHDGVHELEDEAVMRFKKLRD